MLLSSGSSDERVESSSEVDQASCNMSDTRPIGNKKTKRLEKEATKQAAGIQDMIDAFNQTESKKMEMENKKMEMEKQKMEMENKKMEMEKQKNEVNSKALSDLVDALKIQADCTAQLSKMLLAMGEKKSTC